MVVGRGECGDFTLTGGGGGISSGGMFSKVAGLTTKSSCCICLIFFCFCLDFGSGIKKVRQFHCLACTKALAVALLP